MNDKSRFFNRPSIRNLPKREKERRWQQHVQSRARVPRTPAALAKRQRRYGDPRSKRYPACLQNYAEAMLNPFDTPAACLPSDFNQETQKTKVFIRGTLTTNTAGFGWILARARPSNDSTALVYTTPSYAGDETTPYSSNDPNAVLVNHNGAYAAADFNTTRQVAGRVVACGIRIRYIGTELNRAGSILAFEDPEHANLDNTNHGYNYVRGYDRAVTVPNKRQWVSATYQPTSAREAEAWYGQSFFDQHTNFFLNLAVSGAGSNQPFEFEYFMHIEYTGRLVRGKTRNESDDRWTKIVSYLSNAGTTLFDQAAGFVGPRLASYASNVISSAVTGLPPPAAAATRLLTY